MYRHKWKSSVKNNTQAQFKMIEFVLSYTEKPVNHVLIGLEPVKILSKLLVVYLSS